MSTARNLPALAMLMSTDDLLADKIRRLRLQVIGMRTADAAPYLAMLNLAIAEQQRRRTNP